MIYKLNCILPSLTGLTYQHIKLDFNSLIIELKLIIELFNHKG